MRFDGHQVVVTRSGLGARMTVGRGSKGDPLASIAAVQWKPAGRLVNGFLALTIPGGVEVRSRAGRQTYDAVRDENAVVFTRVQMPQFEHLRGLIEQAIVHRHTQPPQPRAPASVADELAKLGDLLHQGLLTRDEFEQQKARILAR